MNQKQIKNQKDDTQNHQDKHNQNTIHKTIHTSFLTIPTINSYNSSFNHTKPQNHEQPSHIYNQDIPESSSANQQQSFPHFSCYPE
jgi:hypothetical protein